VSVVLGDVAVLHGDPRYAGAVFQAASQFNCLEFRRADYTPEKGVAAYVDDPTQGPACAISCAPGTIVRTYFAQKGEPQTAEKQINTIEEVVEALGGGVTVTNGYSFSTVADLKKITKQIPDKPDAWNDLTGKVRVGVQRDTEVTCAKLRRGGEWVHARKRTKVTQVYASAVSVTYSYTADPTLDAKKEERRRNQWTQIWSKFARLVLRAAYEATLRVALQVGAKTVVLTALGGGVFGNKPEWIAEAIEQAVLTFKNAGLKIVFNQFDEKDKTALAIVEKLQERGLLQRVSFGAWPRPIQMYTE
jgi:hypothetical protein